MNKAHASLNLRLVSGSAYEVQFRIHPSFTTARAPDILESLTLTANDSRIALTAAKDTDDGSVFKGLIPKEVVEKNPNCTEIAFNVSRVVSPKELGLNQDERKFGIQFDWIQVSALKKQN